MSEDNLGKSLLYMLLMFDVQEQRSKMSTFSSGFRSNFSPPVNSVTE